jgi:general secretion pathway protein A
MGDDYQQHFGLHHRAFDAQGGAFPTRLSRDEVEPYLVERLRTAGWDGHPMLDIGLAALLHEASGGERMAIDRAMTMLLDEAARTGRDLIQGDGLAAWLDREGAGAPEAAPGLAEAQLDAIEGAFAEHDRKLARLRRELAELRERSGTAITPTRLEDRLDALEARLDQQDAALRHVLERLIGFFEDGRG